MHINPTFINLLNCHGRDIEMKTNDEQQRSRKLLRKLCITVAEP